jgi:hypothetical protein
MSMAAVFSGSNGLSPQQSDFPMMLQAFQNKSTGIKKTMQFIENELHSQPNKKLKLKIYEKTEENVTLHSSIAL